MHTKGGAVTFARYLDDLETGMLNRPYTEFIRYRGRVDIGALEAAARMLSVRHPVLGATVNHDGHGLLLETQPGRAIEIVALDGDDGDLARAAASDWDPKIRLFQIILVHGDGEGLVGFRLDHSIIDGRSSIAMVEDLWRFYTSIVAGRPVEVEPASTLPSPPRAVLSARGIDIDQGFLANSGAGGSAAGSAINRTAHFNREETLRLAAAARGAATSVHGLLCGTVLAAQRELAGDGQAAIRMACWSYVDYRRRAKPPISSTETTYCVGLEKSELMVSTKDPTEHIGRTVKEQLNAATGRKQMIPGTALRHLPPIETSIGQHLAVLAITNQGRLPVFPEPDDLDVMEFGALPPASIRVDFPIFRSFTYKGAMNLYSTHSASAFTEEEVDLLVARTEAGLRRLADSVS